MMDKDTTIGLVGVGLMGHGIAANIVRHGYALCFLEHPGNQPVDDLLAGGAQSVSSLAELAMHVDVVMLCVTGTPQVESILHADDGLLAHLRSGTIVIDCSTAIPSSTRKLAQEVKAAGGQFMDAAMTRTPKEAALGKLNLLVGSEDQLFDECLPLLQTFAENINHIGAVGSGHQMKLLHNYVSLGFSAVLAEAAACAGKTGIDTAAFLKVLTEGGGGGVVLERLRPYIEAQDTSTFRFSVANAHKDMSYYTSMASETGSFHATADGVLSSFARALADDPEAIVPEMISVLQNQKTPEKL